MHSYSIPKHVFYAAWLKVKANAGVAGADNVSIEMFENNLENELYKLWNRMNSGSYIAPPVKRVEIAKSDGKLRPLGIPTVADRVAQMVVKMTLEPEWDHKFHSSSYGYRPRRSAHHAVHAAKINCWKYSWVIDLDIKGFFDNLNHDQLQKFVAQATDNPWCKLYIKRWVIAGVQMPNGEVQQAEKGTPQGGVISPLLANLYLHKVFDSWMQKYFPQNPLERYADDIVCHCRSEREAEQLLSVISRRMQRFDLTLHPDKSKIVYCGRRNIERASVQSFDFLGFTFRRRTVKRKDGKLVPGFVPAISNKARKAIVKTMREWNVRRLSVLSIVALSKRLNPQIRGWLNYYGAFYPSALKGIREVIECRLTKWVKGKYPQKRGRRLKAYSWLKQIKRWRPTLFAHW